MNQIGAYARQAFFFLGFEVDRALDRVTETVFAVVPSRFAISDGENPAPLNVRILFSCDSPLTTNNAARFTIRFRRSGRALVCSPPSALVLFATRLAPPFALLVAAY
jgi:hypothetical protein